MEIKKYFLPIVTLLCLALMSGILSAASAGTIVLDEFENLIITPAPGDMVKPDTWFVRNSDSNPSFDIDTYYTSPYDGSKSVKITYQSNSSAICETKSLKHSFFVDPQNTSHCSLWAYLNFQAYRVPYNFPQITITLYNQGSYVGSKIYYFYIGAFYAQWQNDYVKLSAPSGFQQFDLSKIATEKEFDMLQVDINANACGLSPAEHIIVDHMVLLNDSLDITTTTTSQNISTTTTTIATIQQFCPDLKVQDELQSCVQGLSGDQKQQALDVADRVKSCLAGQTDIEKENTDLRNENAVLTSENTALTSENSQLLNEVTSLASSLEIQAGLLQDVIDVLTAQLTRCGIKAMSPNNGIIAAPETAQYQAFRIPPIPLNGIIGGSLSIVYLDDTGQEIGENQITNQYNSIKDGSPIIVIPRGALFKLRIRPYLGFFQGVTIDSDSEWCHFYEIANKKGVWHMECDDVPDQQYSDKDFNDVLLEFRMVTTTTTTTVVWIPTGSERK